MSNLYRCPLCEKTMERNLVLYLDHTQAHIMDRIKEEHPEWVAADGVCAPCREYYTRQLSGELETANIGPGQRRKRFGMGIAMLVVTVGLGLIFRISASPRPWRFALFLPAFFGTFGLIQAKERTCSVLAERGVRNWDRGEKKIDNEAVARALKHRGRLILVKSAASAAILTALLLLF